MYPQEASALLAEAKKYNVGINPTNDENESFKFLIELAEEQFSGTRYDLLNDTCRLIRELKSKILRREADQLNLFPHSTTSACS